MSAAGTTPSLTAPTASAAASVKMPNYVYGISIGQFLIGAAITVLNAILWLSVAVNPRLRIAPHLFLGNIWFANLLLGIIVAVSNVVDDSNTYVFKKTEGTIAIVNGFVNVAMLLALVTNRVVAVRNPNKAMSTTAAFKIIIGTWGLILSLTLIKTVLFGLNQIGTSGACFDCFLIFEVTTLVFATAATLLTFFISFYLIYSYRNRTIGDSSSQGPAINHQKEYELTLTVGLLLLGFSLTFLAFVSLIAVWLAKPHLLNLGIAEIIITLFYTHCLINPIVVLIRDPDVRSTARSLIRCQRPNGAVGPQEQVATVGPGTGGVGGLQLHGISGGQRQAQIERAPSDPTAPPFELPPVDTPTKTPRSDGQTSTPRDSSDGKPRYGSTERVVVHDEIPPPIGGVAFMTG